MKNTKKTLKVIANILVWIFVVFAALMTVLSLVAQSSTDGVPAIGKKALINVLTPSMEPTIRKGDEIFVVKISDEEAKNLKKDDIITFRVDLDGDGNMEINTHRIVEVQNEDGKLLYVTKGDNNPINDTNPVHPDQIIGVYSGTRIPGLGKFINFLMTSKGFLVCVVLPLLLLVVFYIYLFINTVISLKNRGKKQISSADEELIKQKAVEEYLKQQAIEEYKKEQERLEKEKAPDAPAEETVTTEEVKADEVQSEADKETAEPLKQEDNKQE